MRRFAAGGRTVVFATHYLEEADLYADRIVLMAHGRIVADGAASEIKARVGQRTLTATLPGVDLAVLGALPGVATPDRRGDQIVLRCTDSDATVRALLARVPRGPRPRDPGRRPRGRVPPAHRRRPDTATAPPSPPLPTDRSPPMSAATYTGIELRRSFRNRRFFLVSLLLPVVFLIVFGTSTGGSSGNFSGTGISAMAFYLGGVVSFARDGRDDRRRDPHLHRADGRLEPAAAADPAQAVDVLRLQAAGDATPCCSPRSCCCRSSRSSFGARPAAAALAGDARPRRRSPASRSRGSASASATCSSPTRSARSSASPPACSPSSAAPGTRPTGGFATIGKLQPSWWIAAGGHVAVGRRRRGRPRAGSSSPRGRSPAVAFALWAYRRDTKRV